MIELNVLAEKLKNEKSAAIFCHVRPDGDSIGSAAALAAALEKCGVLCDVYCDDPIPEKFLFLSRAQKVKRDFPSVHAYSALVAIDSADLNRLGSFSSAFSPFDEPPVSLMILARLLLKNAPLLCIFMYL